MDSLKGFKNAEVTPSSGDKGADVKGQIELFTELEVPESDPKIKFKAQVKNKALNSGVSGKDVSRLASRIKEGRGGDRSIYQNELFHKSRPERNLFIICC